MKYAGALGALGLAVGFMVGASACGAGSGPPAPQPDAPDPPALSASAAPATDAPATGEAAAATFDDDLAFLREHGEVIVLEAPSGGVVALSAAYQGRVMTSGVGRDGRSLGYINRDFIRAGKTGTQFDNYGGEDRFWLGPEGGQYALYFAPGQPFDFEKWQTPAAFQEGEWAVASRTANEVVFTRMIELVNYAGTKLAMTVKRTVRLLDDEAVLALLSNSVSSIEQLDWVAFETINGGDVVNSYNDGPVEPGKPALGGFYEIETSSPAAALAVGESLTHTHRTLHFVAERERLGVLAKAALGFTLAEVLAAVPSK